MLDPDKWVAVTDNLNAANVPRVEYQKTYITI